MAAAEPEAAELPAQDEPVEDGALGDTLGADADMDGAGDTCLAPEASLDEEPIAVQEEPADADMENMTLKLPGNAPSQRSRINARAEAAASREDWKRLGEEVKPSHLRVPKDIYHIVDRLGLPTRQDPLDVAEPPPRHTHGPLEPRANINTNIVRAFVHRMDKNHSNLVTPQELADLSVKHKMNVTDAQIQTLFERIMGFRPPGKKDNIGVSGPEILRELQVSKHWMQTMDLNVICEDGKNYHIATEQETLQSWCSNLVAELRASLPPDAPDAEQLCSMPDSWSPPEIERLFTKLLGVRSADGSLLHTKLKSVQHLLKTPSDSVTALAVTPRIFQSVTIVSQRQDWGWRSQPYRNMWLRFFRAAGLNPLQPVPEPWGKKSAKMEMEATIDPVVSANVITAKKISHSDKTGIVAVREPKPKVAIKGLHSGDLGDATTPAPKAEAPRLYDDKRSHTESLVNTVISQGLSQTQPAALGAPGDDSDSLTVPGEAGATSSGVGVSFDARRRFMQMQAKQGRDSEQQRCIGAEKKDIARQASLLGQAGMAVANVGITFRGPHSHLGFSHHHLTNSVEPSRLKYEKELGHSWNGSYVDHTKEAPQKEDLKLSKMTPEERDRQFGVYFNNGRTQKDNQTTRVAALDGVKDIMDSYKTWQIHEFRHDHPQRHGKYGRRVFDAQVRETQIPHKTSGIDSKPMEEFNRQQELVHEFLDRSLPPNQTKHFEPYLPPAQFPFRKEVDMHGYPMTGENNQVHR